ncbi:MAG: hypothetical protein AAGF98_16530, partial [Cyanobacteria bacterium P01_H01_bin.153]
MGYLKPGVHSEIAPLLKIKDSSRLSRGNGLQSKPLLVITERPGFWQSRLIFRTIVYKFARYRILPVAKVPEFETRWCLQHMKIVINSSQENKTLRKLPSLPFSVKLAYGTGELAAAVPSSLSAFFVLYFFT